MATQLTCPQVEVIVRVTTRTSSYGANKIRRIRKMWLATHPPTIHGKGSCIFFFLSKFSWVGWWSTLDAVLTYLHVMTSPHN
jgi:hypothetical protein